MAEDFHPTRADRCSLVQQALQQAVAGTQLRVDLQPDLSGASVVGPFVEAYVLAARDGGIQVDLWRHDGADPYWTAIGQDLTNAVQLAVAAAASTGEPYEHVHLGPGGQFPGDADAGQWRKG